MFFGLELCRLNPKPPLEEILSTTVLSPVPSICDTAVIATVWPAVLPCFAFSISTGLQGRNHYSCKDVT